MVRSHSAVVVAGALIVWRVERGQGSPRLVKDTATPGTCTLLDPVERRKRATGQPSELCTRDAKALAGRT